MNPNAQLTEREMQIGKLIAWGALKKEVADRLYISVHTVENHVRNIFDKTKCRNVNGFSAWYFCTQHNVSFQLSPFTSKLIAGLLLVLFSYGEITETQHLLRARRCRVETERTQRSRSRREEFPLIY